MTRYRIVIEVETDAPKGADDLHPVRYVECGSQRNGRQWGARYAFESDPDPDAQPDGVILSYAVTEVTPQ